MHDDALAAAGQLDRSREPGEAGPDDVDGARHQISAWRSTIQTSRARAMRTGRRGGANPRATKALRMVR